MKLLVVTNRKIRNAAAKDHTLFGEEVNDKGASELRLAWAEPAAGGKWKLELIKEPTTLTPTNLPSQAAFDEYLKLLKKGKMDCAFYVHGFDQSFKRSLDQAQTLNKLYGVGVVLFSWPSKPGGSLLNKYKQAQAIASNSIVALDRTFEKIGFYVSQNPDELCEISLNLIVWSLGNYMFEQFIRNPIFSNETRIFDNIVLDAADVDLDVHPRWTNGLKYARRVYATINERDRILNVSEVVNPERLGNTTTGLVSPRVTYFDLTDGKKVIKKHQHFGNTAKANSTVEAFFKKVLHGDAGLPIQGTSYNTDKNVHELS